MALAPEEIHFRKIHDDMIRELVSSSPSRTFLKQLPSQGAQPGETLLIDTIKNADDGLTEAHSAKLSREQFEAGSKDMADFLELITPHRSVTRGRTAMAPQEIDWGHTFKRGVPITNVVDPTNRTIQAGVKDIFLQEDRLVIAALSAAAVNRVTTASNDVTDTVSVSMPASQQKETANVGYLDLDDLDDYLALFEDEYISDRKYILMSPTVKANFVKNNRDVVKNSDFVNAKTLESGDLTEINGFIPVVSPLVAANKFFCFAASALHWNQFEPFSTNLDRPSIFKGALQSYMVENADCKRIDDLGVIQGTIKAPAT